ncbi:MAG: DUF2336 domain-containing protein [Ancalomicrobiaceae bacterium]|nr:DUF2336 domain-containing protein [Ancalomicrobiaceae bacterium]
MLLAVARLFAGRADVYSERELELFGDVIGRLLDREALADRLVVSQLVASIERTPRDLALKLAGDQAVVAAPVLEQSPVLTASDLIGLASTMGQDHLLAISRRKELPTLVSDVIVVRGNMGVHASVAANPGARLSPDSFARLAFKAKSMPGLSDALSSRPDLPHTVAESLMPFSSPQARQRLERVLALKPEISDDDIVAEVMSLIDTPRPEQTRSRAEVRALVSDIRFGRTSLEAGLRQLTAARRLTDISVFLADLALLKESYVSNVLHKVNAVGIGLVCRSLRISAEDYAALSQLRCEKLKLPISHADAMMREYSQITTTSAERALRYHRLHNAASVIAFDAI